MTSRKSKLQLAFSALTLLVLLTPLVSPWAFLQTEPVAAAPLLTEPNTVSTVERFDAWTDLFRAWVTLPNANSLARLDALGVVVLEASETRAMILADGEQLETLARLRFRPETSDDLGALLQHDVEVVPWLVDSLQPVLAQAQDLRMLSVDTGWYAGRSLNSRDALALEQAQIDLRNMLQSITAEQRVGIMSINSLDSDGDGLTDTEEAWWCTDPIDTDTDDDGNTDMAEIDALRQWMNNDRSGPPNETPWPSWPFNSVTCPDKDHDSVPNMAERWDIGLHMDLESTDRDRYDDGQELFGVTYCPGSAAACGYGQLPSANHDGILLFPQMPAWVTAPGNHPLVAALPRLDFTIVPNAEGYAFMMQTATVVTTDMRHEEGETRSYSTSKMDGSSSSDADTQTWEDWQEYSKTTEAPDSAATLAGNVINTSSQNLQITNIQTTRVTNQSTSLKVNNTFQSGDSSALKEIGASSVGYIRDEACTELNCTKYVGSAIRATTRTFADVWQGALMGTSDKIQKEFVANKCADNLTLSAMWCRVKATSTLWKKNYDERLEAATAAEQDAARLNSGNLLQTGDSYLDISRIFPLVFPAPRFIPTETNTNGSSTGGARTTTHTTYEEHSVTEGTARQFGTSWGTATAVDTVHAADLWFAYELINQGSDYARVICDLAINIYIGDQEVPAATYYPGSDMGGDGCFSNFQPGESHRYTFPSASRIALTLDQMAAIDQGGAVRFVIEDFSLGQDDLYADDAISDGTTIAIDDGLEDGDQRIDVYILPMWPDETVAEIIGRFFPHAMDENGLLTAIWTPEYRVDTPVWCNEPRVIGNGSQRVVWCKHELSTSDWWNIYTNGIGDGSETFQNSLATRGSVALFHFNKDSDLDGYSDRSELHLGTDLNDAASYPHPELLAGIHSIRVGDYVTATLSLLNTGLYDAYGVEAIMIAPDHTISITNNTVGGSGRVPAQREVVVGSHILLQSPLPSVWSQPGHAQPVIGGYYAGSQSRSYSLTVQCGNPVGCDVGAGTLTLAWNDDLGADGILNFGADYASPNFLSVGEHGLKLGLFSGRVFNGETFTIATDTPRDTFQYIVNAEPFTPPVVIISYNDPQGNHRFIVPPEAMTLDSPTADLAIFNGKMVLDPGVEIVTSEVFTPGFNTTDLVLSNPTDLTLTDAHVFLEFVDISGTVTSELPITLTLPPGPAVVPVTWNTEVFSPTFQPNEDYIVLVFWTDWQGNILHTIGRPLSSFGADPEPRVTSNTEELFWDFGTALKGTLMKHVFPLANTGISALALYLTPSEGLSLSLSGILHLAPGDISHYEMSLNTADLPLGPYTETLILRTNDSDNPTMTLNIQGTIVDSATLSNSPHSTQPLAEIVQSAPSNTSEALEAISVSQAVQSVTNVWERIATPFNLETSPVLIQPSDAHLDYAIDSISHSWAPYHNGGSVLTKRCLNANSHWLTTERIYPDLVRDGSWIYGGLNGCTSHYSVVTWSYPSSAVRKVCVGAGDSPPPAAYDHPNNRCSKIWRTSSGIAQVEIFDISGRLTDEQGNPMASVVVSIGSAQTTTDGNGNYRFDDLDAGTYTITPSKAGYNFSPPSRSATGPIMPLNVPPDAVEQNFTGIFITPANPIIVAGLDIVNNNIIVPGGNVVVRFTVRNTGMTSWSRSDVRARATGPATLLFPPQSMHLESNQTAIYEQALSFQTPGVYTICGGYGDFAPLSGGQCATLHVLTPANPMIVAGVSIIGNSVIAPGESSVVQFTVRNNGQASWSRGDVRARATGPVALLFPMQAMNLGYNQTAVYQQSLVFQTPGTYTICGGYGDFVQLAGGSCATLQVMEREEWRYVRLKAVPFSSLTLEFEFGAPGTGPHWAKVDVGGDGTVDWAYSSPITPPMRITTPDLATAFNAYLQSHTGVVDVPVLFHVTSLPVRLHDFNAIPAEKADHTVDTAGITFSETNPTEDETVSVNAPIHNAGPGDSEASTVAFYATVPEWGEWYIGSAFVPGIPAGSTAEASIVWDTLGFTGATPVRVVVDPYNRLAELDEDNNQATASLTILTRSDLEPTFAAFPNPEPVAGETVTVSLQVANHGQVAAGAFKVGLYNGNPDDGGEMLQTANLTVPGGGNATATFSWTPAAPGPHRLFAQVDKERAVNESNLGNNLAWQDIYVGVAGPLLLDSGGASDPAYAAETGYGVLDEGPADVLGSCGALPHERYRLDPEGNVVYRFDHLLTGHFYHLDVTLYECDGAGRQETVLVNGHQVAGPIDLGDGQVHRLSLLLDPALYSGHTIRVEIEAEGIDGALVNEVNLYDVDYRYADAGGPRDPQYPGGALVNLGRPYGWLNGVANTAWGTLPSRSVRVNQTSNLLEYRFDGLKPEKRYNIHLSFWQPSGMARLQRIQLDGLDTGLTVNTGDFQMHQETIAVPPTAYTADGSVVVGVLRTNAATGAMVNEIALEEETLPRSGWCDVRQTPYFTDVYGDVAILSQGAPAGTVIEARNPRGDTVGCFVVGTTGQYGFMRIYGEDTTAIPAIPGMRAGELVAFHVNGAPAVATPQLYWQADYATHRVDLNAGSITGQSILFQAGWNLMSFRLEPPVPTVRQVLDSIDGRYDHVLGETGAYAPTVPDVFNTLKELHPGLGYYVRISGSTSASALIEGLTVPVTTPIPLHQGWNWIGYLPEVTLPITVALQSVEGQYQRVLSLDKTYDPALPGYSTLHSMEPGRGYLIYANGAVTLTYPAAGALLNIIPERSVASGCEQLSPTPKFTLLYGELLLGDQPAPAGSRVEVLTPRGDVAGCLVLDKPGVISFMQVYGEDTTAPTPIPGFRDGEELTFRVNGVPVETEALLWRDDWAPHTITLKVDRIQLYLPLVIRGGE